METGTASQDGSAEIEVTADELNWRERVVLLEKMIDRARQEVIEANQEVDLARAELDSVQSAADLCRQEIVRREGVVPAINAMSNTRGSGLKIEALEAQLLAVKVAFSEAVFEKQSLLAEANALRKRLAKIQALASDPHPDAESNQELDREYYGSSQHSDVVMYSSESGSYRSGVIFLEMGKLVFEPDHAAEGQEFQGPEGSHHHDQHDKVVIDLSTPDLDVSLQDTVATKEHTSVDRMRPMVKRLKVTRGSHLNPLEFVGFKGAIERIHARLAERVKLTPGSDGRSPSSLAFKSTLEQMEKMGLSLPFPSLTDSRHQKSGSRESDNPGSRFSGFGASLVERISQSIQAPANSALTLLRTTSGEVAEDPVDPAVNRQTTELRNLAVPKRSPSITRPASSGALLQASAQVIPPFRPQLSARSDVFSEQQVAELMMHFPTRYQEQDLRLGYSTMVHGISLQTFYSRLAQKKPALIVVRDSNGYVFGGFSSTPWKSEKAYYGTGESFVFSLAPKLKAHKWTRANSYFQFGSWDSIAMGGGGHFAFRLDSEFLLGSSGPCETFGSPCLASSDEFTCVAMEAWTLEPRSRRKVDSN